MIQANRAELESYGNLLSITAKASREGSVALSLECEIGPKPSVVRMWRAWAIPSFIARSEVAVNALFWAEAMRQPRQPVASPPRAELAVEPHRDPRPV